MGKAKGAKGRPEEYDQSIADRVCSWISEGKSLRALCRVDPEINRSSIHRWLLTHEDFRDQYALAREMQAENYFDECLEIADDGTNDTYVDEKGNTRTDYDVIHRSKLRVDTRKWILAKMFPRKYDEPQEPKEAGKGARPITFKRGKTRPSKLKKENDGSSKTGTDTGN